MLDTVRMYEDDAQRARANYDEIAAPAAEEWERDVRANVTYSVELDPTELMCLIASCQLGLRNPEYVGPSHQFAVQAVIKLVNLYPVGSAQRNLAAQGMDPRYDVPSRVGE